MVDKTDKKRQKDSDFYEMMPGYMDSYNMFEATDEADGEDVQVRQKMLRQLLVLVGLLVLQFILFALLMKSTVNLG